MDNFSKNKKKTKISFMIKRLKCKPSHAIALPIRHQLQIWPRLAVYRICRSISRSSSTITTSTPRGVRLMHRMCRIIYNGGQSTTRLFTWSIARLYMASKSASYKAAFKLKVIGAVRKQSRWTRVLCEKLVRD